MRVFRTANHMQNMYQLQHHLQCMHQPQLQCVHQYQNQRMLCYQPQCMQHSQYQNQCIYKCQHQYPYELQYTQQRQLQNLQQWTPQTQCVYWCHYQQGFPQIPHYKFRHFECKCEHKCQMPNDENETQTSDNNSINFDKSASSCCSSGSSASAEVCTYFSSSSACTSSSNSCNVCTRTYCKTSNCIRTKSVSTSTGFMYTIANESFSSSSMSYTYDGASTSCRQETSASMPAYTSKQSPVVTAKYADVEYASTQESANAPPDPEWARASTPSAVLTPSPSAKSTPTSFTPAQASTRICLKCACTSMSSQGRSTPTSSPSANPEPDPHSAAEELIRTCLKGVCVSKSSRYEPKLVCTLTPSPGSTSSHAERNASVQYAPAQVSLPAPYKPAPTRAPPSSPRLIAQLAGKAASVQYTPAQILSPPYESASARASTPFVAPTLPPSTKPAPAPYAPAQASKRTYPKHEFVSTAPTSPIPGKSTCARHRTAKEIARMCPKYTYASAPAPYEPAPARASTPSPRPTPPLARKNAPVPYSTTQAPSPALYKPASASESVFFFAIISSSSSITIAPASYAPGQASTRSCLNCVRSSTSSQDESEWLCTSTPSAGSTSSHAGRKASVQCAPPQVSLPTPYEPAPACASRPFPRPTPPLARKNASVPYSTTQVPSPALYEPASASASALSLAPTSPSSKTTAPASYVPGQASTRSCLKCVGSSISSRDESERLCTSTLSTGSTSLHAGRKASVQCAPPQVPLPAPYEPAPARASRPSSRPIPPLAEKHASVQYAPAQVSSSVPYEPASARASAPSLAPTLSPPTKPASTLYVPAQASTRACPKCVRLSELLCTTTPFSGSTPPLAGKNASIQHASTQVLSPASHEPASSRASRPSLAPATAQTPLRTCLKRTCAVAPISQERPPIKHACVLQCVSNRTMLVPASTLSPAPTSSASHVSERISAVNAPKQASFASSPTQNSSKSTISGISFDESPLRISSSTSTDVYTCDSSDFNLPPTPLTYPYQPPFDNFVCTCFSCRSEIWHSCYNEQELTDNESYCTDFSCSSSDNDYFLPPPPMDGFVPAPPPNPIHAPRRK